ncbi:restriction endonuclease [Streptomyces sp. NPDC030392]|uniref:restriction endonuclease n=1 Tax=Streptomyces sp. NPDC030392 TaxID=3155468 RepID=UPI0033C583D4
MAVAERGSGTGRRAGWRDVVLAVGLVGAAVGGLALLVRTVWGGSYGAFGTVVLALAVAAVVAVARRVAVGGVPPDVDAGAPGAVPPARDEIRATVPPPDDVPVPDGDLPVPDGELPVLDGELPVLDGEAVDHAGVDPQGFEHTVAALCVRDGCTRTEVSGGPGDLGADVVATTPDGRRLVVQCKQYGPDHPVGSQDLQRFGGTCFAVHEAEVAVVVTTSTFTAPAVEYAAALGIVCVDGETLAAWTDGRRPPPWEAAAGR